MIYCGYQGCGKSTYCRNNPNTTVDLDSSMFVKNPGWEVKYVNTALAFSDLGKKVFISAHKIVIEYLVQNNIPFELFIPAQDPIDWLLGTISTLHRVISMRFMILIKIMKLTWHFTQR